MFVKLKLKFQISFFIKTNKIDIDKKKSYGTTI
jgi:hypothetical protein